MKKSLYLLFCLIFISCFTEPKKELEKKTFENNVVIQNNVKKEDKKDTIVRTKTKENIQKSEEKVQLQTFEADSDIYSHFEGCGCYFSKSKDNFIVGKKNVFFGELLGEEGSVIELLVEGKIQRLTYKGSKKTSEKQFVTVYSNPKHIAAIILEKESIEGEESSYWSGSITVDDKYFSLLFGMCGC